MTYKNLKMEFEKAFPDAHFCANEGDDGIDELLAWVFDMVNLPDDDPKSAGMPFLAAIGATA